MTDISCAPARRRPVARAAAALTALAAMLTLAPATGAVQAPSAAAETRETTQLPFDMPSAATLHAGKKVFAHYVPWFPRSLDNKVSSIDYYTRNYVSINGEGGKYAKFGGLMRDRPLARAPITSGDWQLQDMESEVRQAQLAGLDGFAVSMTSFGSSASANAVRTLMAAADQVGNFSIVLRPNPMSSGIGTLTPAAAAKGLADFAKRPAAYRLSDGRVVISPYRAEKMSVGWWQQTLSIMKSTYGIDVAFWPMFLNEQTAGPAFTDLAYGEATWGERTAINNDLSPTHKTSIRARVNAVHARGHQWMQPVSLQDARPAQDIYYEAQNTENLRRTWQIAIDTGADAVHIPTWNDYAEGSQLAPTAKVGWAPLDINAYYLTWFKTGQAPTIKRDAIYLSNRTQLSTTKPTAGYTSLMKPALNTRTYDDAEALVFAQTPATVAVTSGSQTKICQVPAGVTACRVPLSNGTVKATLVRAGVTVASVTSSKQVDPTPTVQDMDYVYTSSLRSGTRAPAGYTAPPVPASQLPTTDVSVPATADSYTNSLAPRRNYGSGSALATRGGSVTMDSYLRFDVPTAPQGKTLVRARLKYWVSSGASSGSASKHAIVLASNSWDEGTMTWKTRPALTRDVLGTTAPSAPDRAGDVPLGLNQVAAKAGHSITLALHSTSSDDLRIWSSDFEGERQRPQLVLTYR